MTKVTVHDHTDFIDYTADTVQASSSVYPSSIYYDHAVTPDKMLSGDGIVTIGFVPVDIHGDFSKACDPFSYLIQPLKEAGTDIHKVPKEYERFLPVLSLIANYEFAHSPRAKDKKANLIIERIKPGEDYPAGEWHQHQEGDPPTMNHVYTVSDIFTTIVQSQVLQRSTAYNPDPAVSPVICGDHDDFFRKLSPYEIGLMTGANIHRADVLPKDVERSFLRVVYEGF